KLQLTVASVLVCVLIAVATLHVLAFLLLPGAGAVGALSPDGTLQLLVRSNLIYFGFTAAPLWVVAVLLMHRIAGPSQVIEKAVRGLKNKEFSHRLTLRRGDYLKGLAAAVKELADGIREESEERRAALRDLERCLEEQDLPAARELIRRLADREAPAPAPAPADDQQAPQGVAAPSGGAP
ncbi:MAG: hypothetical protein ACE5JG_01700, partial [Planctomycetota bacterium]